MSFIYNFFSFLRRFSPLALSAPVKQMAKEELLGLIHSPEHKIVMVTTTRNDHKGLILNEAKRALTALTGQFRVVQLDEYVEFQHLHETLVKLTGSDNFPYLFVKGDFVAGGMSQLNKMSESGALEEWLKDHQYDLVVIGGGSGGLAAAKAAGNHGLKVAVLDFVEPTPIGTTWGLGGTCVNVGCIPKKLMHQASLLGKYLEDSKKFGWNLPAEPVTHTWDTMKQAVQDHIGSLNWGYKVALREKSVKYLNSKGSFIGPHTIKAVDKKGKEETLTADRFLLATGLRPKYLDCPGAKEFCITSDDLFSLSYNPGKTLCVGASYVSLECAGFLRGIGLDVTVMVRSILLRGFDQQMAERIGAHMEKADGITFIREAIPIKIERISEGKPGLLRVTAKQQGNEEEIVGEYNTVLLAIGREAITDPLDLEVVGVQRNKNNKKVPARFEQSSVPHIYAIGDILDGRPELTPVAIQAGRLLAARMAGKSAEQCDYANVPTTVFTPLEYGCCGLAEEDAIKEFGKENIEVFHDLFEPLEFVLSHRDAEHSYAKLICNKADEMRVVGIHYLGPNAGEIMQGFGIALRLKATKEDFDGLIGIHPTCAEVFTNLVVTKSSEQVLKAGGC